jgi:hypothetical protein
MDFLLLTDLKTIAGAALVNTISGLITSVPYIILFIWAVRHIGKKVPAWITQWEEMKQRERTLNWAIRGGKR